MPVERQTSHRVSRPASRPLPVTPPSASRPVARQSSQAGTQLEHEKWLSEHLIRYGCLWEEQAHHIRVKEKAVEGMSSAHERALQRWLNDPEFSQSRGPSDYLNGRDGYVEWIDEVVRSYSKPVADMSIEDHCIVSFAALSAYNLIYHNEPCLQDLNVIGRIHPDVTKSVNDCAQAYQDSEPDFLNHPVYRQWKTDAQQPMATPHVEVGPALVGTVFKYKLPSQRRVRACTVIAVMVSLDSDGNRYVVAPEHRPGKRVTLSKGKFLEIWDARLPE
ncbi:hypothetical protein DAEQUDRAFT_723352 [Daedalea quercina L-15889]|uniref:Uncharacterized protein n=1 Tax=Daedalea quercina L-15889 TaxID=1314783 RepID=A0A165SLH2_9APHY|nr:hypothetical protein DAEQUDRAFT_723352 [Daedalea quercina L-15889]